MTEAEKRWRDWDVYKCRDKRRIRLVACGCVRQMLAVEADLLSDSGFEGAVDAAERYALDMATRGEFLAARKALRRAAKDLGSSTLFIRVAVQAFTCLMDESVEGASMAMHNAEDILKRKRDGAEVRAALGNVVREVFGDPPVPAADPSWLTSTVTALARGICADRAFDRMPILADALQDAGCDNADVLDHCRSDGPHTRGCWVVDICLGKS